MVLRSAALVPNDIPPGFKSANSHREGGAPQGRHPHNCRRFVGGLGPPLRGPCPDPPRAFQRSGPPSDLVGSQPPSTNIHKDRGAPRLLQFFYRIMNPAQTSLNLTLTPKTHRPQGAGWRGLYLNPDLELRR